MFFFRRKYIPSILDKDKKKQNPSLFSTKVSSPSLKVAWPWKSLNASPVTMIQYSTLRHTFCYNKIHSIEFCQNVNLGQMICLAGQVKLATHLPKGQVHQHP